MATKRLRDIDLNIRLTGGNLACDGSATWDLPDVDGIPPQSVHVALAISPRDTVADLIARIDAAAEETLTQGDRHTVEKPTRPAAGVVGRT